MAMTKQYCVDLQKESLIFSAAHFITFGDNICESLHGHNYRVRCRLEGPLNEHGYVVDFIALRDEIRRLTQELDHHVLLPTKHPQIEVRAEGDEVTVRFQNRRWVFPAQDCRLLPVDNTTAERLAEYLAERVGEWLHRQSIAVHSMTLAVDENEGQWGEIRVENLGPDR